MGVIYCRSCGCELQPWELDFCEGCGPLFLPAMKGKTMSNDNQSIALAAMTIAGCIFEDCEETTLVGRLEHCLAWKNHGTAGDLTQSDRDGLRLLLDAVNGPTSNLCNSETNEVIRPATVEEVCRSVVASPEGHVMVDGVQCYVEL